MATTGYALVWLLFCPFFKTLIPLVGAADPTTLVSNGNTALLDSTPDSSGAFDGDEDACVSSVGTVLTIQLTEPIIFTGVNFKDNVTGVGDITVKGGATADVTLASDCGAATAGANDYENSVCPQGIFAMFVHFQHGTQGFLLCEAEIFGFERAPMIELDSVDANYDAVSTGSLWIPVIQISWPEERQPTCPVTELYQKFGTPSDGLNVFSNYASAVLWTGQEVTDLEPNKKSFYNFNLTRVFSDGGGTIPSDPLELSLSRSPFCWSFTCENGTEECIEQFDEADATGNPVSGFDRIYGKLGVCTYLRTYFEAGTQTIIGEHVVEDYTPYVQTWDDQGLQAVAGFLGIPSDLFQPNNSLCYESCLATLYSPDIGIAPGSSGGFPQVQCSLMTRLYCCEEDYCFTAHSWTNNDVRLNQSCAQHLLESDHAILDFAKTCFFPEPYMFETLDGNSGRITFYITESLGELDSVELELRSGEDYGAIALSGYKCTPAAPFTAGTSHSCDIHDLSAGTDYYVILRGVRTSDKTETSWSNYIQIHQGSALTFDCGTSSYTIEYGYGDVPNDAPTFLTTVVQASVSGMAFDEQDVIQSDWPENTFVPSTNVFRGYPSKVHVQTSAAGDLITHLFFEYSFQTTPVINGNADTYDSSSSSAYSITLTNERISKVGGSFSEGKLVAIQFTYVNVTGTPTESPCYGAGDCSGFSHEQQNDEYVVAFSGETDADNNTVALSLSWVQFNWKTFAIGNSSCEFTAVPNWNSINDFKFTYTVSPPSDCATAQEVDETTHRIAYTNQISDSSNFGSLNTIEGEGGAEITRVSPSALYTLVCTYNGSAMVESGFDTNKEAMQHAIDLNAIPFKLLFYRDHNYNSPYNSNEVISFIVNNRIYFGASIKDEAPENMTVYAHTCYARKTDDPDISAANADYIYLEQNGCPNAGEGSFQRDTAIRDEHNGELDPMSVLAFKWTDEPESLIYIHCIIKACIQEDDASCTPPTCPNSGRARRHISDRSLMKDSYIVTSQALMIRERRDSAILEAGDTGTYFFQSTQVTFTFCAIMALFLMKVGYKAYRR